MTMTPKEIIKRWFDFCNYNENQTKFNLATNSYMLHTCCENIKKAVDDFDNTGVLACLYAKNTFIDVADDTRVNLYKVLSEPEYIKEYSDMYSLFCSPEMLKIEKQYIYTISMVVEKITGKKLIGCEDEALNQRRIFESINIAIDDLKKCKQDIFVKGKAMSAIKNFSTQIHLCNTTSECILKLENSADGLYLCYINNDDTCDGYFGFFIKNNGNIIAVHERVDEAYKGQHSRSRNARWTEAKADKMFPYNYIFKYDKRDYKGYAQKYFIDEDSLKFSNLDSKIYMPIVLAMIMISNKYEGTVPKGDIKYIDTLLPVNVMERLNDKNNALIVKEGSDIIKNHEGLNFSFSNEDVLSGKYASRFHFKDNERNYSETGYFTNDNQLFVDLYGEGFKYDSSKLFIASQYPLLQVNRYANEEEAIASPEFIGTANKYELQAYGIIRKQLAEYIRDRIFEEYTAFGGIEAVKKWWEKVVNKNYDRILALCVQAKELAEAREQADDNNRNNFKNDFMDCFKMYTKDDTDIRLELYRAVRLNKPKDDWRPYSGEYLCNQTGAICSIFYRFRPDSWLDIEKLIGQPVPKIIKGFRTDQTEKVYSGNYLLDVCDEVNRVFTPFEEDEVNRNPRYKNENSVFPFSFMIGFSKRGFNQICKNLSQKNEKKS